MLHYIDAFSGFLVATALAVIASECVYALAWRRQRKAVPAAIYIRQGQSRLHQPARR
ncbi:hypothetical protein [Nevskia soli]|uniref:hypothetical protein n=1 Tax=Nevskia soli TaxID=418856 RepID=UPI0012F9684E|nr:hypothetical protein [Nevskia soli]